MYIPRPINTKKIILPEYLEQLIEKLAENNHEVWAARRINEGWTYGITRDDTQKTHPCLVPYFELPESEKEYDRFTAKEVLKVIYSFGFKIEK